MFKLAFAFVLLCAGVYARPNPEIDPFVVGGTNATEGQFPYVVSLRQTSGSLFCGGALISERHVLTAAHCVVRLPKMKVGVGSVNLNLQKFYEVDKITVHPEYNSIKITNDVAVVRLKENVKLSDKVKIISFPVTEDLVGKTVSGLGWGRTYTNGPISNILLFLNRKIIDNEECNKRHSNKIYDTQVCLGCERDYGMCNGDSGSPLVYKGPDGKDYAAGIVSWGVPCAKGYPDVFTRVSSFEKWIKENMV